MIACPDERALLRGLTADVGDGDDAVAAHVERCLACRAEREGYAQAIELARELPFELPPPSAREEMRTSVLAAAAERAARLPPPAERGPGQRATVHRRWALAAGGLAATALILVGVRALRSPPAPTVIVRGHGAIHAAIGAHFTTSAPPDEVVRLREGDLTIDVAPLHPGERYRVVVGDGEVEVRGTAFEVVAKDDRLLAVNVVHGRVEVRPAGRSSTVLGPGEGWSAAAPVVSVASTVAPSGSGVPIAPALPPSPSPVAAATVVPPPSSAHRARGVRIASTGAPAAAGAPATTVAPVAPVVEPAVAPAVAPRSPDAVAYDQGWAAMRAVDFGSAADAFARVASLGPDPRLADDALFWRAVALARDHQRGPAMAALRVVADDAAGSVHADEASVMLGWLLLEDGDRSAARARFRAAERAAEPRVRSGAQAGLVAVDAPL